MWYCVFLRRVVMHIFVFSFGLFSVVCVVLWFCTSCLVPSFIWPSWVELGSVEMSSSFETLLPTQELPGDSYVVGWLSLVFILGLQYTTPKRTT